MTRVLLLSTYELGGQPLGLAGPATALIAAGHEVRACDLAVEEWPGESVAWADAVACSVPMHTALRLGLAAVERVRTDRPEIPVAYYGLYAPVASELDVLGPEDITLADALELGLVTFADRFGSSGPDGTAQITGRFILPGLDEYARYVDENGERLVGPVESTVGCNHRCRHCPVPLVFDGRSRAVDLDAILADVATLVALGATHIHFADPDFLNRPQHARRVAAALADRHRGVTFDATIKVSHLLRHAALLPELAESGLRFVISAFESTSDTVLARLDKGHVAADLGPAVGALREAGIEPRPSLLPFTPWTTRADLVELLDFVARHDLVPNVDAVQYGIRLLLPPHSLLLDRGDTVLDGALGAFDETDLGFSWTSRDPLLDEIAAELQVITEAAAEGGEAAEETYRAVRETTFAMLGVSDPGIPPVAGTPGPAGDRPHLTEAWFCCAEPTSSQLGRVGSVHPGATSTTVPIALRRDPAVTSLAGRPVAMCGFMGSGKTSVGRQVARALGRTFTDSDDEIERRFGLSIPEIFSAGDEPLFRATEATVVADLVLVRPPGVISLGGGALEDRATRDLLFGAAATVYLDRPLEVILGSLGRLRRTRPLLATRSDQEIASLYAARAATYQRCHISIAVGDLGVGAVTELVLDALAAAGVTRECPE